MGQASGFDRKRRERQACMEAAQMEIVQGVTLEAISAPALPDTESLLGELGSLYPILTYPAGEAPIEEGVDGGGPAEATDARREELDASIMAGLLWP
jgi:hypothetical protein